ncbi:MAG: DUF4445 domain-containing protein [Lachnospiraceae bacterium]|nr:DUF4445 domain-containing protein [Lachnospiraceae bacterium]
MVLSLWSVLLLTGMKKGTKCTICTGCGRCFGDGALKTHILSFSGSESVPSGTLSGPVICADIGTTTIAMICCDEHGQVLDSYASDNPQGKYGADVISRIRAASDPDVLRDMKSLVEEVLRKGTLQFLGVLSKRTQKCSAPSDEKSALTADAAGCVAAYRAADVVRMFISANTTMSYLLLGLDPSELGEAPFYASHLGGGTFRLQLSENESIEAVLLPGFSAFVGSDITAGILASNLCGSDRYRLLCDLGTNGEIALGNKDHLYVTATAAGPAFEGGPCRGIWGADMIHFASVLLDEGVMDGTGLLADPYFDEGISIGSAVVTQESIRALQLAKGAMNAGIRILIERAGISYEDIEVCILAGGFGYFLKPEDAACIGLIPEEIIPVCRSGGNTSLIGALEYASLTDSVSASSSNGPLSGSAQTAEDGCISPVSELLPPCTVINLAEESAFSDLYMSALNFENI